MNLKGRTLNVTNNTNGGVSAAKSTPTQTVASKRDVPKGDYVDNTFQTIDKIESKGARVEFLNTGFDLKKDTANGKVRINFQKLDDSNHQIAFGSFYLGFEEISELREFIQHDLADKYVEALEEANNSRSKYAKAIYTKYAGTVGEGNVISRVLELTPGMKEDLVITYKEGPGAQNAKTKLITPAGKMTKTISVPLSVNRLIGIVDNVSNEIIAYKAAVHTEKRLEAKFAEINDKLDRILRNCE